MGECSRMIKGSFIVFDKKIANELIKRGFPVREIGGNIHTIFYFDDLEELHEAIAEIKEKMRQPLL